MGKYLPMHRWLIFAVCPIADDSGLSRPLHLTTLSLCDTRLAAGYGRKLASRLMRPATSASNFDYSSSTPRH